MITDEQILKASQEIAGNIVSLSSLERQIFQQLAYNGAKWMQEQTRTDFLAFVHSTSLDQKEKDLIRGVFYDWSGV